jgi:hypothetical protein
LRKPQEAAQGLVTLLVWNESRHIHRSAQQFSFVAGAAASPRLPLFTRSSQLLASGSKTAAQPQMQEQAPLRANRLGAFQQTPAEDLEITDRLLTIESRACS